MNPEDIIAPSSAQQIDEGFFSQRFPGEEEETKIVHESVTLGEEESIGFTANESKEERDWDAPPRHENRCASRMVRCDSRLNLLNAPREILPVEISREKIVPEELNESSINMQQQQELLALNLSIEGLPRGESRGGQTTQRTRNSMPVLSASGGGVSSYGSGSGNVSVEAVNCEERVRDLNQMNIVAKQIKKARCYFRELQGKEEAMWHSNREF